MTRKTLLAACCATLALTAPAAFAQVAENPVIPTDPIVVVPDPDVVVVTPAPDPVVTPEPDVVVVTPEPDVVVVTPPPEPANAGAFDALSPGGQKIARALYAAQSAPVTTASGTTTAAAGAMSLDDIAAARGQGGWGQVFKQMQASGTIQAKNLGQVVSGHAAVTAPVAPSPTPVVVSYGDSGSIVAAASGKGHKPVVVTADGTAAVAGAAPKAVARAPHVAANGGGHAASAAAARAGVVQGGGAVKAHGNKHTR